MLVGFLIGAGVSYLTMGSIAKFRKKYSEIKCVESVVLDEKDVNKLESMKTDLLIKQKKFELFLQEYENKRLEQSYKNSESKRLKRIKELKGYLYEIAEHIHNVRFVNRSDQPYKNIHVFIESLNGDERYQKMLSEYKMLTGLPIVMFRFKKGKRVYNIQLGCDKAHDTFFTTIRS